MRVGDGGTASSRQKQAWWKVWLLRGIAGVLLAALLATVAGGGWLVVRGAMVWRRGGDVWSILSDVAVGLLLLSIPVRLGWDFVRRRIRTGRSTRTREEQIKALSVCKVQGTKRVAPGPYGLWELAVQWGRVRAFDGEASAWERAGAWTVVGAWVGLQALCAGLAVVCCGAAFAGGNTFTQGAFFLLMGVAFAILPALWVRGVLLRRRAGGFAVKMLPEELPASSPAARFWGDAAPGRTLARKLREVGAWL